MKALFAIFALVLASASPAAAQFAVDGSIGATVPVGQYGRGLPAGLDLMGAVEWRPLPIVPIAIRAEVGWDRIGAGAFIGAQYITRLAFDAVVTIPLPGTQLRPYVLAGGGIYHFSVNGYGATNPGYNVGAGLRYPIGPVQGFFE